jgi:hypothetical protein
MGIPLPEASFGVISVSLQPKHKDQTSHDLCQITNNRDSNRAGRLEEQREQTTAGNTCVR